MIRISCKNERFTYDMYHIVKSFLPDAEISQKVDPEQELLIEMTAEEEPDLEEQACDKKVRWTFFHCREAEIADISEKREQKRYINKKLYQTLVKKTGEEHAWGNMTGVRPTKMIMERLEEGSSEEEIIRYMHDTYVVSEKKAMLGIEIAKREKAQLDKLDYENGYSLYIGIPFCPTTCSYCSFTSYPVAKWQDRMDEYVDALLKELAFIAEVSKEKHLNAIYMGGGTPTTLSAQQMDRVLSFLEEHFSFEHLKEYTIEAGKLNQAAGYTLVPDVDDDQKIRVYVLDDDLNKKPYGAWGQFYIMNYQPIDYVDVGPYPFGPGVVYQTGVIARILPNGSIDFMENTGRTVLTDGAHGRRYFDLKKAEKVLESRSEISHASCYMIYDPEVRDMVLKAEIHPTEGNSKETINTAQIIQEVHDEYGELVAPKYMEII